MCGLALVERSRCLAAANPIIKVLCACTLRYSYDEDREHNVYGHPGSLRITI